MTKELTAESALEGHDVKFLQGIATDLKQRYGGEGWAIGEMVERVIKQHGQSGTITMGDAKGIVGDEGENK